VTKVGILGGTFNPIHLGHLITAQAVKEIRNLDMIIFVPAYISPHKTNKLSESTAHRLRMLQLAIEEIPCFEFSDIELKARSISYTVKTLEEFKKKFDNLEFIIGYDNIINFHTWKNPDKIIELAELVVLRRKTNDEKIEKDKYYKAANFVKTPVIEISSSEIRNRIKGGKPIDFLVPKKVKEYINTFNLYKE
jgi:nicotinate-nucleotide adenylyltransferase